jgi:transposase-like protein
MSSRERRERWFDHVRRAQRAGGSVAEYARSIQVAPRVLYYWCDAFRRQGAEAASAERGRQAMSGFTAVRVEASGTQAPCADSALRLLLPDGAQLQWSNLPSPQWLAAFAREWSAQG